MGSQLHEALAVAPSRKAAAGKILVEAAKTFRERREHFQSDAIAYLPDKEGEKGDPPVSKPLVSTVGEKLRHVAEVVAPWTDVEYQIDATNAEASADLTVDGLKLEKVPATFLLQLGKQLTALRAVYDAIPTLDPQRDWAADAQKGKGVYKAVVDEKRVRTRKTPKHEIIVPPTENHPAQVSTWTEDERVGLVVHKRWSGEMSPGEKAELLKRLDRLQQATKRALAAANRAEHVKTKVARVIFDYLHEGIALAR